MHVLADSRTIWIIAASVLIMVLISPQVRTFVLCAIGAVIGCALGFGAFLMGLAALGALLYVAFNFSSNYVTSMIDRGSGANLTHRARMGVASCEIPVGWSMLDMARRSAYHHRWNDAQSQARAAQRIYLECAQRRRGTTYVAAVLSAGRAELLTALATIATTQSDVPPESNRDLQDAYAAFVYVEQSPAADSHQVAVATRRADVMRRLFPVLPTKPNFADIPRPLGQRPTSPI